MVLRRVKIIVGTLVLVVVLGVGQSILEGPTARGQVQESLVVKEEPNPTTPPRGQSDLWWEGASRPADTASSDGRQVDWREAERPAPGAKTSPVLSYDATFEHDLYVQTDLVLPGIGSVQTVAFTRPRTWALLKGTELRLLLEHSSSLIPERSHLTVYVNDTNIQTIVLDDSNASTTEVRVPVPLENLKDFNTLKLEVHQHYTNDCEDPFDPALWTKVSRRSFLHFEYQWLPVVPDLGQYPLPLFDRQGYGPTVFRFVFPGNPSARTLDALALVSAGLGREVSYGHLAVSNPVSSIDGARGHIILVGTPQENPDVNRLVGGELGGLAPGEGLVALKTNPSNDFAAVLVVTGRDPDGVLLAARTLSSSRRHEVLSGQVSLITRELDVPPAKPRERPRFLPPDRDGFTLEDIGAEDTTVRGFYASPIRIELRAIPDIQFYERRQTLNLHYSYGAQLEGRLSTLEVRWNNITLQSIPLTDPDGENDVWRSVNVPEAVIAPYNDLQLVFNLFPRSYDPCSIKTDKQLWGTVFGDSSLSMPHYFWAEVPDLGKLKYGLYPFGLYQDLSETVIVLPNEPGDTELLAGASLAAELGRATVADRIALSMVRAGDLSDAQRKDRHLIVVGSGRPNSLLDTLRQERALRIIPGEKILSDEGGDVLQARDPNNFGTLEQIISPFGGTEKTITVVQGLTPDHLKRAIRAMTDIRLMSQLSGSIALAGTDNRVASLAMGKKVTFGERPMTVELQEQGRDNYWLVILLLFVALFLIYLCLRFLLRRYRRKHHGGDGGDGGEKGSGTSRAPGVTEIHPNVSPPTGVRSTELVSSSAVTGGTSRSGEHSGEARSGSADGSGERPDEKTQGRPQRRLPPRRTDPPG